MYQTLSALSDELLEIAASTAVQIESIELNLPLDIRLPDNSGNDLVADLPLFRLRTAFDPEPARVQIRFVQVAQ